MKDNVVAGNRKEYLDYLRVFATFFVIQVHVATANFGAFYFDKNIWRVFSIYDSMGHWTPAAFVMISGALFLSREIDIKKLYSKYILRVFVAFLVWNFVYYLLAANTPWQQIIALFGQGKSEAWADLLRTHYHMWYIQMIIGVYMCIPILKRIADNEKIGKYFIAIGIIFSSVIPVIYNLISDFGPQGLKTVVDSIKWNQDQGLFSFPLGYMYYFVLGYYLANNEISKKLRMIIYILGIGGFIFTALLSKIVCFKYDDIILTYYDSLSIQVFFTALAIFVFFKYLPIRNEKLYKLILGASKVSFGAYLIHALVIEQLAVRLSINTLSILGPASAFKVLFSTPLMSLLVFAISMLISAILSKIPVIKKIV